MTSTRRLSGAVALGLSVALTGAFAAPSFAAPAEGAEVETTSFTTITVDGESYAQLTENYSDGTVVVTVFTDADNDQEVDEEEEFLTITETKTDGTKTVTDAEGVVTVTAPNGTVTETIEEDGVKIVTVFATNGTVTETITWTWEDVNEEGEEPSGDDESGDRKIVLVTNWDSEEDYEADEAEETYTNHAKMVETETFTTTDSTSKSVTVTAADGTVTETVTVTTTETVTETVREYGADGETVVNMSTKTTENDSDAVTEVITEAGKDGEVGTDDDVLTVIETAADGTGTKTVYKPGATYSVDEDGNVTVTGEIATRSDITPEPEEPAEPTITFTDNPEGSAYYLPVQWMAENGISVGYADGTFKKTKDVTRNETAAFLFRYIEPTDFEAPEESPFGDLNVGGAFFDAITWAADEEITVGDTQGNFNGSSDVTRGEFAAFLYRLSGVDFDAPETSPFGDLNAGGANYEAITWLASEEITVGDTQGDFNQSDEITRGEISAFMQRYDATVDAE